MATPKKPSLFAQRMLNSKLKIKSDVGDSALPANIAGPVISRCFGKQRIYILCLEQIIIAYNRIIQNKSHVGLKVKLAHSYIHPGLSPNATPCPMKWARTTY